MQKFNFKELVSNLEEDYREFEMADTVAVYFKGNHLPIKINGIVREELKVFRGSFCIYDVYDESKSPYDYDMEVEVLVFEEYADSPHSIYIHRGGRVEAYGFEDISSVEIGNITLSIKNNLILTMKTT